VPDRALDVVVAAERVLPPLGGTERALVEEALALAAAGHRVRTIGLDSPEGLAIGAPPPAQLGWTAITQPEHGFAFGDWRARVGRVDALSDAVRDAIGDRRPDVIVTANSGAAGVAQAATEADVPFVIGLHGYETLCHWRFVIGSDCVAHSRCRACPRTLALDPHQRAARIAHADGHRDALAGAAALIAPSRLIADEAQATCGRRSEVIVPSLTVPAPAAGDIDGPVLAVASLWTRDKGADLLAPIADGLPGGRTLIVQAGDEGRRVPLAQGLVNHDRVTVRSAPAETAELLGGCSAVVVPTQIPEAWGRVAFEAMAAGIPLLASDIGGLREFVPASQRVAPHDDAAAWVSALGELLEPERWEAARAAGLAAAAVVIATRPARRFVEVVERAAVRRAPVPAR
jgi:glycosyltransferase involved in cell wall biosynthesis